MSERPDPATSPLGLCPACEHVKRIASARGSVFLRCTLARTDVRFPKYPPQPVRRCPGFTPEVAP